MKLGRGTAATAAGIVLVVALGGCQASTHVHAGQAASADTPTTLGSWPAGGEDPFDCGNNQSAVSDSPLNIDAPGEPSPQALLHRWVSNANREHPGRPAISEEQFQTRPGSDMTRGPVAYEAHGANGKLRASFTVQHVPKGGWEITGSTFCASFLTDGK